MSDELVEQLRSLARAQHDDLSLGNDAANRIEALERDLDSAIALYAQTKADLTAALARAEASERDARRWRYLSDKMTHEHSGPNVGWTLGYLLPGEDPDSAIDAAIAEEGK